jgi:GNAT superfamily N-acetyltransferase
VTVAATPKIIFQREPLTEGLESQLAPLMAAHWSEVAPYRDIPLDVDWPLYHAIDRAGALRIYTARRDGKILGYVSFVVRPHLHYKQHVYATCDALYLLPEERGHTLAARLIGHAAEALKAEGTKVMSVAVPESQPRAARFLQGMGWHPLETSYSTRLD